MKLLWKNETHGNNSQHYKLKRQTLTMRPFLPPHTHDHAEVIYVQRGSGLHQVNGIDSRVAKGDVLFIYPETVEHYYHECDTNFTLLQILFPQYSFRFIKDRYVEDLDNILGEQVKNPLVSLDPMQQIWFERNFDRLLVNEGALINIERFLLNFLWLTQESHNGRAASQTSWLDRALRDIHEPKNFCKGHQGFVDLCSLSAEHVAREVKKRTGRTVTDAVNQARMDWATYMLTFSDVPIIDISLECGIESISHFYKLFHDHCGSSPAKYRKQAGQTPIFGDRPFIPY